MPKYNDYSEIFHTGRKFAKKSYNLNTDVQFLFHRGIVLDVNRNINSGEKFSAITPPFSIKVKIIGEDLNTSKPETDKGFQWAKPLSSLHDLKLPEKGEEVLLMRETFNRDSILYWVNRYNDTPYINKSLARNYVTGTPLQKYGFDFRVEDIADDDTETNAKFYSIPARNGDVFQQGRTNTYIRHSYNPINKTAVLETGIKNNAQYELTETNFTIGITKTKTIHLEQGNIRDVVGDLEKVSTLNLSTNTVTLTPLAEEKNVILNYSNEIYNVTKEGEPIIYKNILGEKLNSWLNELTLQLKEIIIANQNLMGEFLNHTHSTQPFSTTEILNIDGETYNVNVNIPSEQTTQYNSNIVAEQFQQLSITYQNVENSLTKLEGLLSQHNFLN